LGRLAPETIRFALTKGTMAAQGAALTSAQTDALIRYLASAPATPSPASDPACPADETPFAEPFAMPRWNGWSADLSQTRFQPAAMAQLTAAQVPTLALKWAFGFPGVGQMYAQPTVVGGRVFVGSAGRKVYSLSATSGCQYWSFDTDYPVRTAISVGAVGGNWAVYFGDQHANAYAVDAVTGQLLWKAHVEEHVAAFITGAPTLAGGKLYVPTSSAEEVFGADPKYPCCTFRGSVTALDAATGRILWKSYTIPEEPRPGRPNKQGTPRWGPSGAAVWSSPTVDLKAQRVYVATGDSYSDPAATTADAFVAFDSETGKLVWSRQMTAGDAFTIDCDFPDIARANCPDANGPDFDFGSSPILVELANGRRALIAGQKSGLVHAVDPDRQGEVLWQRRVGKGGRLGGVQWGSAADAEHVYVAVSDVQVRPAPTGTPGAQKSMLGILTAVPSMDLAPSSWAGCCSSIPDTPTWAAPQATSCLRFRWTVGRDLRTRTPSIAS
jgi:polyvinyl alcohol dehydrogenase (cytochrome)